MTSAAWAAPMFDRSLSTVGLLAMRQLSSRLMLNPSAQARVGLYMTEKNSALKHLSYGSKRCHWRFLQSPLVNKRVELSRESRFRGSL